MKKKERNWKVIWLSLLAFAFLYLTYTVDWIFIAGAAIILWINQKELFKTQEQ